MQGSAMQYIAAEWRKVQNKASEKKASAAQNSGEKWEKKAGECSRAGEQWRRSPLLEDGVQVNALQVNANASAVQHSGKSAK